MAELNQGVKFEPNVLDMHQRMVQRQQTFPLDAVFPGAKVASEDLGYGAEAMVRNDDPYTLILNGRLQPTQMQPHLVPHEAEHMLQNRVRERTGHTYDKNVLDIYTGASKLPRDKATERIISTLKNVGTSKKLRSHLESMGITPSPYIGGLQGDQFSLREAWADLSALEQTYKKDLTTDPVVQKEFFGGDKDLIATYKATTGLRMDRLDAKDLPPMTIQATKEQSLLDKILGAFK